MRYKLMNKIIALVDCYVEGLIRDMNNSEIAVLGPHLNGLLVDFRGEIPTGGGYKSDQVAWRADKMRAQIQHYARARALMMMLTVKQRQALIQWRLLIDRHPQDAEHKLTTITRIAHYLGVKESTFRSRVDAGILLLNTVSQ